MATVPQLRTCVAAGRFNPTILSPAWIVANAVLPDGQTEAGGLVGTNVVQFSLAGITWQPTLTKLEVIANSPEANPGQFVTRVLTLLSHTPVNAVGSNFVFQVPEEHNERLFPLIASKLQPIAANSEHEMLDYSAAIALKYGDDCVINLKLDADREKVHTISFNFNRFVPNASAGAEAALNWSKDESEALRLYEKLLGGM